MSSISEFLWHASGMCGEHWHPNAINVTAIVIVSCIAVRMIYKKFSR